MHGIHVSERLCGLIASRLAPATSSHALRIVGFYGTAATLAPCGSAIRQLLRQTGDEYTDLFSVGLSDEALTAAGFAPVDKDESVIVSNHFEPFERSKNGSIAFAFCTDRPVVLFRADGDQDRPNLASRSSWPL